MRTVTYRLERIEQLVARVACPVCRGRTTIIAYREDEPPPDRMPCSCGQERVLRWVSQSPASLDPALRSNEQLQ